MESEKEKSGRFLIVAIFFLLLISTAQGAWDNDDLMYAKGTSGGQVHNTDTEEDFKTIQDAIDDPDTKDGHNISVDAGIYRERVVINKQLKVIGENKDNTIIDAYGSGNCIKVTADNVEISGFRIKNGNYGIYLESSNCNVTDNNIISIDFDGIFLRSNSVNNTIAHNSISEVKGKGIRLSSSCNNRIDGNDLSENGKGISLSSSHNNTFYHNRLTDNSNCGICLSSSNNNSIQDNDLSGSEEGIFLRGCNKNYIYHNNFIENRIQASDSSDTNRWDNGSIDGGNYWSDHECTGNPSDGNQRYIISGGIMGATDFYPFMDRDGWLVNLTVTIRYPNGGESIPVGTQVPVSVHATDDTAVTNVTFFYSSNGGSNWNIIGAGIRVSGTDKDGVWNGTWNTNGLSVGSKYMIKAVVSDGTLIIEDLSESTFSLSCTLPSPPTLADPGTNDSDGNYTVSWSSVSCATNYTLEEDTSSSFSSPTKIYSGSGTSKEITGKSEGTYYYRVMACNECGCSKWSNIVDIKIRGPLGYAIIIAGGKNNEMRSCYDHTADNVYEKLQSCGFADESIFYLNINKGRYVDRISSLANVSYAINNWTQGNVSAIDSLLIYMVDHGKKNTFFLNGDNITLTATDLGKYLNIFTKITRCNDIVVVCEANASGSFIDELSGTGRIIVTSTGVKATSRNDEIIGGVFSHYFFDKISTGKTIKDAFVAASNSPEIIMHNEVLKTPQKPLLDDNGDGVGHNSSVLNKSSDGTEAASKYICSQWDSIASSPTITSAIQNKNKTYNYTIRTGSYPDITHEGNKDVLGGGITSGEFIDANGYSYNNRIPAVRLEGV